jgi:HEAT repeat protein
LLLELLERADQSRYEQSVRIAAFALADLTEALVRIGGERVEAAAAGLLRHPDENQVRRQAVEIVFRLQRERALPLARRMLAEEGFGRRSAAALFLSNHGVPEDLETLIPLSDFWAGDRENHYWLQLAVSGIRQRHGYDLNGPIKARP